MIIIIIYYCYYYLGFSRYASSEFVYATERRNWIKIKSRAENSGWTLYSTCNFNEGRLFGICLRKYKLNCIPMSMQLDQKQKP